MRIKTLMERSMAGAAYLYKPNGRVFGPEYTHGDFYYSQEMADFLNVPNNIDSVADAMWDMIDRGELVDGFVSSSGKFYTREDAAKAIKLDPTKGDSAAGHDPKRDWLDALDLDHVDATIHEDTELDVSRANIITNLSNRLRQAFEEHLKNPTINSDHHFHKQGNDRVVVFLGQQLGWPAPYQNTQIILRGDDKRPMGQYESGKTRNGKVIRRIYLSILPEYYNNDSENMNHVMEIAIGNRWQSILIHELRHLIQDHDGHFLPGAGSFTNGEPSKKDYFNDPVKFEAFYHQATTAYHSLLLILRNNPDYAKEALELANFDYDFKKYLNIMLPTEFDNPAFGAWYNSTDKQNRRWVKRLYGLHQAILKELDRMNIHENDEEHHAALDATGFWGNAGSGCIILASDTKRILLPKRSQWVEEPGTWGVWGGAIDRGEDPKEAAIREVSEEAGYTGKISDMVHLYTFTSNSFRYDTFVAIIDTEFKPTLNWESSEYTWVEFGEWPSPLHFGLKDILNDASAKNKLLSLTT